MKQKADIFGRAMSGVLESALELGSPIASFDRDFDTFKDVQRIKPKPEPSANLVASEGFAD